MELSLLSQIGLIIVAATILAILASKTRQPLILAYFLAGILIGPGVLGYIQDPKQLEVLSEFGIALLLFIIGMELDVSSFKGTGALSSLIGLFQVAFGIALGFFISSYFGLTLVASAVIGLIASLSSTMIVAKMLKDKLELDSLHGELVLGILIVQDVLAIIALSLLTIHGNFTLMSLFPVVWKGLLLTLIGIILAKFVLPSFLDEATKSTELLFIGSLTILFSFAAIAAYLDYSIAIGAFIAGISLSNTPFIHEISGRIRPLKDFFLTIFFVVIGINVVFSDTSWRLFLLLLFLAMMLKPIVTFTIMKIFSYSNRTAFLSGTAIAQVSEFSLVIAAIAMLNGILTPRQFSAVTLSAIVSMTLSSYAIKYNSDIFNKIEGILSSLDRLGGKEIREYRNLKKGISGHIVVFGMHRIGEKVVDSLTENKRKILVVDYRPEKIKALIKKKIQCIYSDITNPSVYEELNLKKAKAVISTIRNFEGNLLLIKRARRINKTILILIVANSNEEAIKLYDNGADYVVIPLSVSGEKLSNYITHLNPEQVRAWGKKYYSEIKSIKPNNYIEV